MLRESLFNGFWKYNPHGLFSQGSCKVLRFPETPVYQVASKEGRNSEPKMPARRASRTMKHLLFWGSLACLFLGVGSNPEKPPSHWMSAIQGGSVSFRLSIPSEKVIVGIEWNFKVKDGSILLIGESSNGKWKRPNPEDQFGDRLELVNQTMLRVHDLKTEDGGIYTAHVRFDTDEIPEYNFPLAVYEPVPTPRIFPHLNSFAPFECNVTLECNASGAEGLNVSWTRGNRLSPLEGTMDGYNLSNNGKDLHLAWRHNSSDSIFTCLVSNPVDEKRTSFNLLSVCTSKGKGHPGSKWALMATIPFLLQMTGFGT
uniref:Ig-like domain-containing protein n=1 Tax=Anolis carolinensis TaxID=28377 RepID=A0A803TZ02_ANOCA|nr:PREDICTED: T-lymphocyte surface antigen Ly-9 [Anolis carolinensis]|eukprot:XP_003229706.2 PREDICTED: T-lymphocyte surface antigen Ly-9 [Anolis carolinensis]